MRRPIAVQVEPFDTARVQPLIDAARIAFIRYLEEAPRRSIRSKHGVMGPVGKILSEVRNGRHDSSSLKGYALRIHEAMGRSPSASALDALSEGIDTLVDLLCQTPVTARERVLDRLDYGLYYELRRRVLERREALRQAWSRFLREKYGDETRLSESWGEKVARFVDLYLPKKAEGSAGQSATVKQQDIAAFWAAHAAGLIADEEES